MAAQKPLFALLVGVVALGCTAASAQDDRSVPAPKASDWAALAKLPDLSGTWLVDLPGVFSFAQTAKVPWKPEAAAEIKKIQDDTAAGKPSGIHNTCLPLGMPGMMLITHNAMEILVTPGRITMLGEGDGNNLRRIHTDGRKHPADPDPTYHGDSIGYWEGNTLVIDTVGIRPETWLNLDESLGVPIGEGAHVVEHLHLSDPNTLVDDVEVTAPAVLSATWKASRKFFRDRKQMSEIIEGECLESDQDKVDANGHAVFVPK